MATDDNFDVLEERFDGMAYVLMALIADLEKREQLDGRRFCGALRPLAAGRRRDGVEVSALTIEQFADRLDAMRETRRKEASRARSRIR